MNKISWKIEEYVFGAVALRDEIRRHKKEDKQLWPLHKAIWIRMLFIYAIIAAIILLVYAYCISFIRSLFVRKDR